MSLFGRGPRRLGRGWLGKHGVKLHASLCDSLQQCRVLRWDWASWTPVNLQCLPWVVARCAHGSLIWMYSLSSLIWNAVRPFCFSLHYWFKLLCSSNSVQVYGSWSLICEGDIPGSIGRGWRTGDRPIEFFDSGIHCRSRSALRYDHFPGCLYVVYRWWVLIGYLRRNLVDELREMLCITCTVY